MSSSITNRQSELIGLIENRSQSDFVKLTEAILILSIINERAK